MDIDKRIMDNIACAANNLYSYKLVFVRLGLPPVVIETFDAALDNIETVLQNIHMEDDGSVTVRNLP